MARKLDWDFSNKDEQYPFTILVNCPNHSRMGDLGLIEYRLDFEQNVHAFGDWATWFEIENDRPTGRAFVGFKSEADATMAALLLA